MDGLVFEGVRLLGVESVVAIPAHANTYAVTKAGEQGLNAILQKSVRNLQTGPMGLSWYTTIRNLNVVAVWTRRDFLMRATCSK